METSYTKEEILAQTENLKKAYENISLQNTELEQQKEEILAQSEQLKNKNIELEKLSVVARETDNAIAVFDKNGDIEWLNDGFTKMYGYTLEQLIKKKGTNIVSHSINPKIKEVIQSCIDNKKTAIYQKFAMTKNDKGLWIQTTLTPIFEEDEVINFIAIDSDITKIKDAENEIIFQKEEIEKKSRELEKLSIVARETNNAIVIMDSKGNFEWVNESFTRMYGYTLRQFISEKGGNLLSASYNKDIKTLINNWLGLKEPISYQALNLTKSGEKIWAQTTLTPIIDDKGNISKIVLIDSNISKLKQAEKQIRKKKDELQKANITKDKFFSILAHDLRSPFNSILGLSNILKQKHKNMDVDKRDKIIQAIYESSNNNYTLLNNLLEWSRSQRGKISFIPESLIINELVEKTKDLHASVADSKGIKIIIDLEPITINADKNMIETVLRNLISNSIKYSNYGDIIHVKFSKSNFETRISVSDTGIGINEIDRQRLFEIGNNFQIEGTAGEKGTGLGLIICKEFIDMHHGKIWADSEPGKGSTFHFTIPDVI